MGDNPWAVLGSMDAGDGPSDARPRKKKQPTNKQGAKDGNKTGSGKQSTNGGGKAQQGAQAKKKPALTDKAARAFRSANENPSAKPAPKKPAAAAPAAAPASNGQAKAATAAAPASAAAASSKPAPAAATPSAVGKSGGSAAPAASAAPAPQGKGKGGQAKPAANTNASANAKKGAPASKDGQTGSAASTASTPASGSATAAPLVLSSNFAPPTTVKKVALAPKVQQFVDELNIALAANSALFKYTLSRSSEAALLQTNAFRVLGDVVKADKFLTTFGLSAGIKDAKPLRKTPHRDCR